MRNLDRLAAQTAQEIVKRAVPEGADEVKKKAAALDNLATKVLGVLQENGVYAASLFLYSRSGPDEKIAPYLRRPLLKLAGEEIAKQAGPEDRAEEALPFVTVHISDDLDTLLLVKQVWERTLIYTRYGAKARGGGS